MRTRAYTPDEVQEKFLRQVWRYISYWERESRAETSQAKMEGLAHSILSMIDGSNIGLPAWILAPLPHADDKAYNQANGEKYFPINKRSKKTGNPVGVKSDIGGNLAYQLYRVKEKMDKESK
jgi:hypothetical protein